MVELPKEKLPTFLNFIAKKFELIAPIEKNGLIIFDKVEEIDKIKLDYVNTNYPPKDLFLPDEETLFEFRKKGKEFEFKTPIERIRRVLFGIRPCDLHALFVLDKIFIEELKDPFYLERRKNTTLIVLNCKEAGENCFCESLGTNKVTEGFDLSFTEMDGKYLVEVGSEMGKKLINKLFKPVRKKHKIPSVSCKRKIDIKKIEKEMLKIFWHDRWEDVAERCLSCGACTVVCPTCYCFGVFDEVEFGGKEGKRKRRWSSCMLLEFSRIAGNFVFRKERKERCKQFIFHKLNYFKQKYGKQLCVGCGRCVEICPTNIDFFKEVEGMLVRK